MLITVVLGLAVTGLAFFLLREWQAQEAWEQFEKLADGRREILQRRIKANLEVLYSLANFFRGSQKVELAEFRTFVEEVFQRHPDLFSLQWRPRVQDSGGKVYGAVCVFRDISDTRDMVKRLTYQATHDALTGLINRPEFERRLERVLSANASDAQHALLYLDLDQFKVVNDTCGHAAGDDLLRQITLQLRSKVRKRDTLARFGGDEFGVLLEYCTVSQALRIADELRGAVSDFRFTWQDRVFAIGVSIGLVPIPAAADSLVQVLMAADSACYAAKGRATRLTPYARLPRSARR